MSDRDQNTPKVSGLTSYVDEDEINLLDYWRVLMKRKRLLALILETVAIASVIISLYLPKIYASTTSLLPPQDNASGLGMIAQLPSGLSGLAGGLLGGESTADLWVGILKSQTVLDVAKVPEKRVKPKRTLIVLLSTFTASFFGIFLVFFLEYIEKAALPSKV